MGVILLKYFGKLAAIIVVGMGFLLPMAMMFLIPYFYFVKLFESLR